MASTTVSNRLVAITVWMIRILVGGTFIISGGAKMIDPYGFVYKISEYFSVWHVTMPDGVILLAAVGLSIAEFLIGFLLLTGSYKRSMPVLALIIMAVMLPLSLYLVIADPVEHCGCFGDFLIVSNTVTFIKNLLLTAALVWMLPYNRLVGGLFPWFMQWIQAFIAFFYIGIIGLIGYHEQPLIDFRPYKIGTALADSFSMENEADDMLFIYAKDGLEKTFTIDNLPGDDWTFVRREEMPGTASSNTFSITDADGLTVTDDVVASVGEQLILLIPQLRHPDISLSYVINELNGYITDRGGSLIAVGAGNESDREQWIDLSMADYPVYFGEDTSIKSVARGKLAVVYLRDGIIKWKRTLSSVNLDDIVANAKLSYPLDALSIDGHAMFMRLTWLFLGIELLIALIGYIVHRISLAQKKSTQK